MEKVLTEKTFSPLPKSVGIIMDGNGRWATKRNRDRSYGHKKGCDNVEKIVEHAFKRGVRVLTLYAFSTENWQRPKKEVDELMKLLKNYFTKFIDRAIKNKIRVKVIGDISVLNKELQDIIIHDEKVSESFSEYTLCIAINYGGRQEIVNAVNKLIKNKKEISVENISANLYTSPYGEPDLIIRTGGQIRLSNFLLFQGAYSELYFTDVLWPDFSGEDFDNALLDFSKRKRNFGKV